MTESAPQAQPQYDSQSWHVEFTMHVDADPTAETYMCVRLNKKQPLGSAEAWIEQSEYVFLPGQAAMPEAGWCWHEYMVARLDELRVFLIRDHAEKVKKRKNTSIRPEIGVSYPSHPYHSK